MGAYRIVLGTDSEKRVQQAKLPSTFRLRLSWKDKTPLVRCHVVRRLICWQSAFLRCKATCTKLGCKAYKHGPKGTCSSRHLSLCACMQASVRINAQDSLISTRSRDEGDGKMYTIFYHYLRSRELKLVEGIIGLDTHRSIGPVPPSLAKSRILSTPSHKKEKQRELPVQRSIIRRSKGG
jgi:hypothetical protein